MNGDELSPYHPMNIGCYEEGMLHLLQLEKGESCFNKQNTESDLSLCHFHLKSCGKIHFPAMSAGITVCQKCSSASIDAATDVVAVLQMENSAAILYCCRCNFSKKKRKNCKTQTHQIKPLTTYIYFFVTLYIIFFFFLNC